MYTCQAERGRILNASPYYSDDRATLYGGDALAVLAALPSGSVDAVVCDPPYSSGGMVRGDRAGANTVSKYVTTQNTQRDSIAGVAAMLEGRKFVGVEMVEHYQRIAERRIREAQGQAVTRGDQGALDFDEEATA